VEEKKKKKKKGSGEEGVRRVKYEAGKRRKW
jgi:hypothetical protein